MNWIALPIGFTEDPCIAQVAARCGIAWNTAFGAITRVLTRLPKHARDGNISAVPDEGLEQWAQYPCPDRPGVFAAAFRAILCDDAGVVMMWEESNGAAIRESDYDAERKRLERARKALAKKRERDAEMQRLQEELALGVPAAPEKPKRRTRTRDLGASAGPSAGPSDGRPPETGRDVTSTPTMPDGMVAPLQPAGGAPEAPNSDAPDAPDWERELFAVATPVERVCLESLAKRGTRSAVLGFLHLIGSGAERYVVRGKHSGVQADMRHVVTAAVEWELQQKAWNTDLFRAFVRIVADRREEPATPEQREAVQQAHTAQAQASVAQRQAELQQRGAGTSWRDIVPRPGAPRPRSPTAVHIGAVLPDAQRALTA